METARALQGFCGTREVDIYENPSTVLGHQFGRHDGCFVLLSIQYAVNFGPALSILHRDSLHNVDVGGTIPANEWIAIQPH